MTKNLNFGLKIKGGGREGGTCEVLRPCHPPKFETCTWMDIFACKMTVCSPGTKVSEWNIIVNEVFGLQCYPHPHRP